MTTRTDDLLAVEAAMTEEERTSFLERWTEINPRESGAGVADVLDRLDSSDAHVDLYERIAEQRPDLDPDGPRLYFAVLAVVYGRGKRQIVTASLDRVVDLLRRIEFWLAGGSADDVDEPETIVHRCPPTGQSVMPCCGVPPGERLGDRMSILADFVTCPGARRPPTPKIEAVPESYET